MTKGYKHITIEPLTGIVGAEVSGIDLAKVSAEEIVEVRDALDEFSVLVFKDQDITPEEQVKFTANFGTLRPTPHYDPLETNKDILVLKREAGATKVAFGGMWHTDEAYFEVPCCAATLRAVDAPPYGSDTMFASCNAAYDFLSPPMQKIADSLIAVHSAPFYDKSADLTKLTGADPENTPLKFSGNPNREVEHPLVCVNRRTGRKALWVNIRTIQRFKGMTPEESKALLDFFLAVVQNPSFTCRVRYRKGSVAMWDNFAVMHVALSDNSQFRREMHRVQVADRPPVGPATAALAELA